MECMHASCMGVVSIRVSSRYTCMNACIHTCVYAHMYIWFVLVCGIHTLLYSACIRLITTHNQSLLRIAEIQCNSITLVLQLPNICYTFTSIWICIIPSHIHSNISCTLHIHYTLILSILHVHHICWSTTYNTYCVCIACVLCLVLNLIVSISYSINHAFAFQCIHIPTCLHFHYIYIHNNSTWVYYVLHIRVACTSNIHVHYNTSHWYLHCMCIACDLCARCNWPTLTLWWLYVQLVCIVSAMHNHLLYEKCICIE